MTRMCVSQTISVVVEMAEEGINKPAAKFCVCLPSLVSVMDGVARGDMVETRREYHRIDNSETVRIMSFIFPLNVIQQS